jgi:hypothetical protein
MIRHVTLFTMSIAALASASCKKKDAGGESAGKTAEAPKEGCGTDFADPDKQFCVKLPAGYKLEKANKEEEGSVRYEFEGPQQRFNVLVWGNPQFTFRLPGRRLRARHEETGSHRGPVGWHAG